MRKKHGRPPPFFFYPVVDPALSLDVGRMRLITHNLLRCNAKRVKTGFPLKIVVVKVYQKDPRHLLWPIKHVHVLVARNQATVKKKEFNAEFIKNFLAKVDWPALVGTNFVFSFRPTFAFIFPSTSRQKKNKLLYHFRRGRSIQNCLASETRPCVHHQ